ncbi:hypothetical protein AnigIFM63326_002184, partial [Aspergillus niger]
DELQCKICYSQAVNLVLGCGHAFCHACFVHYVHILDDSLGREYLAGLKLRYGMVEPHFLTVTRNLTLATMPMVVASFLYLVRAPTTATASSRTVWCKA